MKLIFWGVRGCIPAPGSSFARFGGNTSCVAVEGAGGELVILDAGTGLIELGKSLMGGRFGVGEGEATMLLSHAHWDHIQGFPFFVPVHIRGNRFRIFGAPGSPEVVERILEGQMNPHFMPVQSLRNLGAEISFAALRPGGVETIGGLSVRCCAVPHGRSESLAFRLQDGDCSMVFVPDVSYPGGQPDPEILAFYEGADALVHDCTFSREDWIGRRERGYASVEMAAAAAIGARVRRLVMFHYDQDYQDRRIEGLMDECRQLLDRGGGASIELVAAAEGETLDLG